MGWREPSKVIGQGSDKTGEALYGGGTGSMCMGSQTGDGREEATVSLEVRAVEGNGERGQIPAKFRRQL